MPLDDQLSAVDELIDAMDLSTADRYLTYINYCYLHVGGVGIVFSRNCLCVFVSLCDCLHENSKIIDWKLK